MTLACDGTSPGNSTAPDLAGSAMAAEFMSGAELAAQHMEASWLKAV